MVDNRYMGVEQEFVTFDNYGCNMSFGKHFHHLQNLEASYFPKSSTSIRTMTGHGVYVDGSEFEVCTPPVRLNHGFATRLTDLVMIGREKIVRAAPDLKHTGYSMHWNLSLSRETTTQPQFEQFFQNFYKGFAFPFHLFGITPVSTGLGMRYKVGRAELLGDYITQEEQINALALLLGAYTYAFENLNGKKPPIRLTTPELSTGSKSRIFAADGRYSQLNAGILTKDGFREGIKLQGQHYLELFYQWVEPAVKALATKKELENLEGFIFGNKKLEFDYFNYFSRLLMLNGKHEGTYRPIGIDEGFPCKTVVLSGKERELPLEGRLLGDFVKNHLSRIRGMDWTDLRLDYPYKILSSIDEIYAYAQELSKLKLDDSPSLEEIQTRNEIIMTEQKGPKKYRFRNDISVKTRSDFLKSFYINFKEMIKSQFSVCAVMGSLAAAVIASCIIPRLVDNANVAYRVNSLVEQYTQSQTNSLGLTSHALPAPDNSGASSTNTTQELVEERQCQQ
jgi:hypothetical protein